MLRRVVGKPIAMLFGRAVGALIGGTLDLQRAAQAADEDLAMHPTMVANSAT